MSREIVCLLCKKALGEVATGSRLRPGTAHLCEEHAATLTRQVAVEAQRNAAAAFAKNKTRPTPGASEMGDVLRDFGKIFGINP